MTEWTNAAAAARWSAMPTDVLAATAEDGDFAKRHLLNPVVFRMLGDVAGRAVLDAGCGNGYFARMLADRGARVTGLDPADGMIRFARDHEAGHARGIRYVRADLSRPTGLDGEFDAVVCNMVLMAVPEWRAALAGCVRAARPGGSLIVSVVHPAFEGLWRTWREHGEYRSDRYLTEYEVTGPHGPDFHRPLSAYLNALAEEGCRLVECAEPALPVEVAERARVDSPGIEGYTEMPNFLILAARTASA